MRYFYDTRKNEDQKHGVVYSCNHTLYNKCTLYLKDDLGLAVVQQRFSPELKYTFWSSIDRGLVDDIFNQEDFQKVFNEKAGKLNDDGLYPTIKLRKLMWALRMKPLKREFWEE